MSIYTLCLFGIHLKDKYEVRIDEVLLTMPRAHGEVSGPQFSQHRCRENTDSGLGGNRPPSRSNAIELKQPPQNNPMNKHEKDSLPTIVETDRLILREIVPEDLPDLAALYADPIAMQYMGGPRDTNSTRTYLQQIFQSYTQQGFGLWATIQKSDRNFIGRCGLLQQEVDGQQELEIGYAIAPQYWNRGLATEAARAIRDWARAKLPDRDRLISITHIDNLASQRVAQKVGMQREKRTTFRGFPVWVFALQQHDTGNNGFRSDRDRHCDRKTRSWPTPIADLPPPRARDKLSPCRDTILPGEDCAKT